MSFTPSTSFAIGFLLFGRPYQIFSSIPETDFHSARHIQHPLNHLPFSIFLSFNHAQVFETKYSNILKTYTPDVIFVDLIMPIKTYLFNPSDPPGEGTR